MNWAQMLAYITGTVDQELLLRNEYLAAENRILRAQIKGRLLLADAEKATLAEIAHRLGRNALEVLAAVARPETAGLVPKTDRQEVRRIDVSQIMRSSANRPRNGAVAFTDSPRRTEQGTVSRAVRRPVEIR
jgi:hypothetical protein